MKILFISDIHGIPNNLEFIAKKIAEENIDKLICLGDLYYRGLTSEKNELIDSQKVHKFLTKYKDILICMRGNCDSDVDIKASDFPICEGISLINIDNLDIYLTHGNIYSYSKNRKITKKGLLVYGHEHIPYIKKDDNMIYVCVGSISLPREGDPTYAIYNNKEIIIYDIYNNIIDKINIE